MLCANDKTFPSNNEYAIIFIISHNELRENYSCDKVIREETSLLKGQPKVGSYRTSLCYVYVCVTEQLFIFGPMSNNNNGEIFKLRIDYL